MKITLVMVGKTDEDYLQKGIDVYFNRLKHYINVVFVTIPSLKNSKNLTFDQQKRSESELIMKCIINNDSVVLLSEEGKSFRSAEFAKYIEKSMLNSIGNLVFIIGGPYGVDATVRKRANIVMSLSDMTFSHQMVRLFFVEQLYRAMTILKNEPYHHE